MEEEQSMSDIKISATVVAGSSCFTGHKITTLVLVYPRFIHSELMTHRVFSRNAMSSRAVPVAKMIEQVRNNPAMPIHWGLNQPGMQAEKQLADATGAQTAWRIAAQRAADDAEGLAALGLHKQVVNRLLEPFQWMRTIVTATDWNNFFELRLHPDAQPEFQALARAMCDAMVEAQYTYRRPNEGESSWHLPFVTDSERDLYTEKLLPKLSAARCARVSYLNHDNTEPSIEKDIALFDRLVGSTPLHASPIEHQAVPSGGYGRSRNFTGWIQFREMFEKGL